MMSVKVIASALLVGMALAQFDITTRSGRHGSGGRFGMGMDIGPEGWIAVGAPGKDGNNGEGGMEVIPEGGGYSGSTQEQGIPNSFSAGPYWGFRVAVDGVRLAFSGPYHADTDGDEQIGMVKVMTGNPGSDPPVAISGNHLISGKARLDGTDSRPMFGFGLSMDGGILAVGAPRYDRGGTGGADQPDMGAGYLYTCNAGGSCSLTSSLEDPFGANENEIAGARVGAATAVKGSIAVFGAPGWDSGHGHIIIYSDNGGWGRRGRIAVGDGNDQLCGMALAISQPEGSDTYYLAVGCPGKSGSGKVVLYSGTAANSANEWTEVTTIQGEQSLNFGFAVDFHVAGDGTKQHILLVGATGDGGVVYGYDGNSGWSAKGSRPTGASASAGTWTDTTTGITGWVEPNLFNTGQGFDGVFTGMTIRSYQTDPGGDRATVVVAMPDADTSGTDNGAVFTMPLCFDGEFPLFCVVECVGEQVLEGANCVEPQGPSWFTVLLVGLITLLVLLAIVIAAFYASRQTEDMIDDRYRTQTSEFTRGYQTEVSEKSGFTRGSGGSAVTAVTDFTRGSQGNGKRKTSSSGKRRSKSSRGSRSSGGSGGQFGTAAGISLAAAFQTADTDMSYASGAYATRSSVGSKGSKASKSSKASKGSRGSRASSSGSRASKASKGTQGFYKTVGSGASGETGGSYATGNTKGTLSPKFSGDLGLQSPEQQRKASTGKKRSRSKSSKGR